MTPFEALYGKKPNVKHLRAFGCVCYPLIMKDERKKLDPVAKWCILVGYGTEVKGYRVYNPDRVGKIMYSRDVKFNESEFRFEKESSSQKPISRVELEVSSADESDAEVNVEVEPEEPVVRRSGRIRQRPDYYGEYVSVAADGQKEPDEESGAEETEESGAEETEESGAEESGAEETEESGAEKEIENEEIEKEKIDQAEYQSAVGSLLYLSTGTRPDIAFAVNNVAKFCSDPTKHHWVAVKQILRYLRGTSDLGLLYTCADGAVECLGYSDSDWAGDLDDRRSTSGYIFMLSSVGISWKSKKQTSVALSTAEAEYMALSGAVQEAMWLRQLVSELMNGGMPTKATVIHEDNQSTISLAKNPQFHGRAKHIDIQHHFVREKVNDGTIELIYCSAEAMVADVLTKGLSSVKFETLRMMASVTSIPTHFTLK